MAENMSGSSTPSEPAGAPTPDADRTARRARLLANLDLALGLAEQLGQSVTKAFPEAAAKVRAAVDPTLSVDERIALGDAGTRELTAIAMQLAPEATLDGLEATLDGDRHSQREAAAFIARMKSTAR